MESAKDTYLYRQMMKRIGIPAFSAVRRQAVSAKGMRLSVCILLMGLFGALNHSLMAQDQTVGLFYNQTESYQGYTLFGSVWNKGIFLIDNCGNVVNRWETDFRSANSAYLLENGNLLRTAVKDGGSGTGFNVGGTGERLQILDWDNNILWDYIYATPEHILHHDIVPMPNGNILALTFENIPDSVAIAAGRDPSTLDQGRLFPDGVVEIRPIGTDSAEIVWEWWVWDHLVQDFDATKPHYGEIAAHPELFDLNYQNPSFTPGSSDWTHGNGIDYNPELDQVSFSFQLWSEFYIIDHSTSTAEAAGHTGGRSGKGGDLLYRWGNPETYGRGTAEDRLLWGPHGIDWIEDEYLDGGKLIIFNNGNWRSGYYSEVFVIDPPQDGAGNYTTGEGAFGPVEPSWAFGGPDRTDFYSWFISNAQRLPNGNTLICEGYSGELFEVTSEGREVWRYVNPQHHYDIAAQYDTIPFQGLSPGNATFRVQRYAPDFAGFTGKDMTPGDPLEINPIESTCEVTSIEEAYLLYPNPASDEVHLFVSEAFQEGQILELFNLQGKKVRELTLQGNDITLDTSTLRPGHYRLRTPNGRVLKLVILH